MYFLTEMRIISRKDGAEGFKEKMAEEGKVEINSFNVSLSFVIIRKGDCNGLDYTILSYDRKTT